MSRRGRERRRAAVAAAKERRKKILAFGGLGLLVLVLAIQVPRILDLSSGAETVAPAPPAPAAPTAPEQTAPRPQLGSMVDPFAVRRIVGTDSEAAYVAPPAGERDPFRKSGAAAAPPPFEATPAPEPKPAAPPAALPNQIVLGEKPSENAVAKRGWIVIIQSIPVRSGRASADRFAAQARRSGVKQVAVLDSSTRRPLRAGYFVVYNGPYGTLRAVQQAAAHVHALGYGEAYVRTILRYEAKR